VDKKKQQLGMNPSTASNRLVKDILWKFICDTGQDICCKCSEPLTRSSFSIEHIVPWLDSEDPVKLFFDLENISFSHLKCNVSDKRQSKTAQCGTHSKYTTGCRCFDCTEANRLYARSLYTKESRREKYLRKGY